MILLGEHMKFDSCVYCRLPLPHGLINIYTLHRSAACVQRNSKTVSTLHQPSAEMDLSGVHLLFERERENRDRPMIKYLSFLTSPESDLKG